MERNAERLRKIRAVLGWVLLGNLAVAVAKMIYGAWSKSVSIQADGLHSLTDSASNVIGLIALAKTQDAPDEEHPYGHHKLEVAGALAIGFLILLGLSEIARSALHSGFRNHQVFVGPGGYGVVFFTLLINSVVTWQEKLWGGRLKSPILLADAQHTLSDSFATLGVLAAFILSQSGFPTADLIVAFFIMILVGRAAYGILKEGMNVLLDRSLLDAQGIEEIVRGIEGVRDCHRVRSRGMAGAIFVDFHILVDSHLSVEKAHTITHRAESLIREKFPEVVDVLIHTEPVSDGREPYPWEGSQ